MRGGLHLLAHTDRVVDQALAHATVPAQLTFKLAATPSDSLDILVRVAESVLLGQPLARCGKKSIHASVSGTVRSIDSDQQGCRIVVDNDARDTTHASIEPIADYRQLEPVALRTRIAAAGIEGLGGAAFATGVKLDLAAARGAELLVVNGAECEPFIACDDALMRTHAGDIVLGTQALLYASGAQRAIIAIESDMQVAIDAVGQALATINDERLSVRVIDTYYPAGGERQLIELLTQQQVPSGGLPQDIGVTCQNVGTAAAIAHLITSGRPLIERIVTVTGGGVVSATNLVARIGTPITSLISDCGGYTGHIERLIMGGSMMGVALQSDDEPVTAATNCIIAATSDDLVARGPEMPCIRCGECAQVCPASLLPQQLLRYARLSDRAALAELGLADCIECGCCDYVCPSHIPLTSNFVAAKNSA